MTVGVRLLASLALTWASTSAYATDVLWSSLAQPGAAADFLIVLQGFQDDPLATALVSRWGEHARSVSLDFTATDVPARLHACGDAEDEAQRAAACVIEHVNAGRSPVALVANDRLLTRRVSAMLHGAGLSVRDETGWKLSTTHRWCTNFIRSISFTRECSSRWRTWWSTTSRRRRS